MLTKKNRIWAVVALLTGVIGFSSCLKNDNNFTNPRPQAQILFLGSSTSTAPANFFDNDQKITDSLINFNFYARYAVYGGLHKFDLKKQGGDSLIASTTFDFDSTQYYTYLIWNKAPVRTSIIKTDQTNYSRDKIGIRFLNLSENAGAVDVYVGSEKIDSNRTYFNGDVSSASIFKPYSPFSVNNTVTIKAAGTTTELANNNSLRTGYFTQGNFYTIYLVGVKGSTGTDKLQVNSMQSLY